jgi:uncharacterized protein
VSLLDLLDEKRPEILRIAAKHGARDIRLFGSVARGEDHEGSDVDLLAEIHGPWAPEWPLKEELEQLLRVRVHVISSPHPYMRDRILEEAISLEAPNFRELAVIESQRPHEPLDRDNTYLRLVLDYCNDIIAMAAQTPRDVFLSEKMPQRALVMTLILLGETAAQLSQGFRTEHPEIPWNKIIGLRNVSVHDYTGLELPRLWDQDIRVDVPQLKAQLEKLL